MDPTDMVPMLEALDDNLDDVEEALSPLLRVALSDTAGRLPVLDKAQLYVLVTYAIESILFCRCSQYFFIGVLINLKQHIFGLTELMLENTPSFVN